MEFDRKVNLGFTSCFLILHSTPLSSLRLLQLLLHFSQFLLLLWVIQVSRDKLKLTVERDQEAIKQKGFYTYFEVEQVVNHLETQFDRHQMQKGHPCLEGLAADL